MQPVWITAMEAKKILGIPRVAVRRAIEVLEWPTRKEFVDGRIQVLVRMEDVNGYEHHPLRVAGDIVIEREAETNTVRKLVAWADGLSTWPSYDEIAARVTNTYRYKDIVSVLENRTHRTKGGYRWIGRPKGSEHDDQRIERKAAVGVGAGN